MVSGLLWLVFDVFDFLGLGVFVLVVGGWVIG